MRPKFYKERRQGDGATEEKRAKMEESSPEDNGTVRKKHKLGKDVDNGGGDMDAHGGVKDGAKPVIFKKKKDFILDLRKKKVGDLGEEGRSKEALSLSSSPQSFSSSPQTVDGKSSPEPEEQSVTQSSSSRSASPVEHSEAASAPSSQNEAQVNDLPAAKESPSVMTSQHPPVIPTAVHPWGILPPGTYGHHPHPLAPRPPPHLAIPYHHHQAGPGKGMPVFAGVPPHLPFRHGPPPHGLPVLPPGAQHPARLLLDFSARAHGIDPGLSPAAAGRPSAEASPSSRPDPLMSPEPSTSSGPASRPRSPESSEPSSPTPSTSTSPADGGSKPGSAKKDKDKGRNLLKLSA